MTLLAGEVALWWAKWLSCGRSGSLAGEVALWREKWLSGRRSGSLAGKVAPWQDKWLSGGISGSLAEEVALWQDLTVKKQLPRSKNLEGFELSVASWQKRRMTAVLTYNQHTRTVSRDFIWASYKQVKIKICFFCEIIQFCSKLAGLHSHL